MYYSAEFGNAIDSFLKMIMSSLQFLKVDSGKIELKANIVNDNREGMFFKISKTPRELE